MQQLSRRLLSLAFPGLVLLDWLDWGGPWVGVFAFALGVGIVALHLSDRRVREADGLTVLNIQR
jgi:hypothetical protein